MSEPNRLQINWVNSAGGALGAVSSAVLLSSLGAAGTLVGAALGSLCVTVGGAVYSHYLTLTRDRVASQALAARRTGRVRELAYAGSVAQPEDRFRTEDPGYIEEPDGERSVGRFMQGLAWRRIAVISAALFVVAMVLIVAFELSTGRAVSTFTGGTSSTSVGTSIPGWSGTGQDSLDVELEVPLPGEVQDGEVPQEPVPIEDAPLEDVPQEPVPPQHDAPQEQAPPLDPPTQQAPETPAP
ncbi:hypothetical protein GA707_20365 [Nostocoides sp. F2B08]|uniref:hypothetical protein n=1 Tax=Nostocoides sp. F2B08 TaxID=2653936 RepID=UPI001262C598|nr:hypothetical protein [Tetrasphaera sp. F2B08]KAB7739390.1 hypothetical protein GA707_20365 [Tetrasphaera sp. F2B08]